MVFKNFIQYLINKYLKNYIERFDYEKVKFSLKSGNIVLENLHLKPEALAYLNIPATVAVGYLEQLKVTIPWNNLSTNPTEVHIDGVYLLIVPKDEMSQDLTEHYADKSKRIQQKLDNLRKAWYNHSTADNGKFDTKELDFVEKMRFQVMQNLIVTIRNLHISYEMKSPTKLGHPFSFGITFHYLELSTANNVKLTKGNKLLFYRVKEINSLSIYWNTKCKSRLDMPFTDVLNDLKNENDMRYILHPVNLITELVIILKPKEHHYERSTLSFKIIVPQMNFNFDAEQLSDLLDFIKFQNYTTIYDRCREYRELLLQDSLGAEKLTSEQKQRIQFLESKLDVFHLAYIRHKVEIEVNRLSSVVEKNTMDHENTDTHRSRWNSWSKVKNSLRNLTKTTTTVHVQSEREQFFEDLPKLDMEINFNKVDINLLSPTIIIACISIIDARIDMKRMCVTSQVETMIELQSVRIVGMQHDEAYRSVLMMPLLLSSSSPLVHIEFELFSVNQKSDYRFYLIIEPIKIIYHAPTINQLIQCFEANGAVSWKSEPETIEHFSSEKIFDMTINLKGASVLLPQGGVSQQDLSMVRIDFGNMMFKSCLKEKVEEQRASAKYKLELNDLRMLYSHSNKKRLHILQRTPLIDIDFYKYIYSNGVNLPNWRIDVKIAMGNIRLSKTILTKLILHFKSLPLLYSNLTTIIKRINFYFTLFSPHATLITDLSIYNCCLRLLMYPELSIRTDLHIYLTKTRDENCTDSQTVVLLNEPTMMQHICSQIRQSSRSFYQNEHIKLVYSSSAIKL